MTGPDLDYIKRLIAQEKIIGPVLELGAGYEGNTCRQLIMSSGIDYYSTDMQSTQRVDYIADFTSDHIEDFFYPPIKFKSILILNVLEHTLNPLLILDNARKLLANYGTLIVIAPCSWTLHNYPIDCYRFMPNFFEQYAASRKMQIDKNSFEYIGYGQISSYKNKDNDYCFPLPSHGFQLWKSRIIHRIFNTCGRGMTAPSTLGIGAVFTNSEVE
jgi:hypothetical protein